MENSAIQWPGQPAQPDLAAALRARIERINRIWQDSLAKGLPKSDGLPKTLENLAEGLRSGGTVAGEERMHVAEAHGPNRSPPNGNLAELLIAQSMLRAVVLREVSEQLGRALSLEESLALNARLDQAAAQAMLESLDGQTRQSTAAAGSLSKSMSTLSHDLRGTLNGVVLMIDLLCRRLGSEEKFAESLSDLEMMRQSILDAQAAMDRNMKDGV